MKRKILKSSLTLFFNSVILKFPSKLKGEVSVFEKIPLEHLYIANYVMESLEYVYSGLFKSISIIHHFNLKKEKDIFVLVTNSKNRFVGYMSLNDRQIYQQINIALQDYEVTLEDNDLEKIKKAEKVNSGYVNFEPLKNYSSKYIKPYMSYKDAQRAIKDINRQISEQKEKVFKLIA